jgi:hypothetical protein
LNPEDDKTKNEYACDSVSGFCLFAMPVLTVAQTDEIPVYDGEIAPPGIFNSMVHNNFTPKGRTAPDYPGAKAQLR